MAASCWQCQFADSGSGSLADRVVATPLFILKSEEEEPVSVVSRRTGLSTSCGSFRWPAAFARRIFERQQPVVNGRTDGEAQSHPPAQVARIEAASMLPVA
jgi:hypothetical protein